MNTGREGEARGRDRWPSPRPELVASVAETLRQRGRGATRGGRAALALAFTVVIVGAFTALGGIGLAASTVTGKSSPSTAAQSQYQYPGWFCLSKKSDTKSVKYKLLFASGPGDYDGWTVVVFYGRTPGPCPP